MAVTYGFYNSIGGDRKYDAVQMSAVFDGIIKDGVFDSIGEIFKVTPGTGLQVVVGSGRAWFDHTWTLNDAKLPLTIEAPDVTLKRYDAVVLEVNSAQATRANSIKVVTGTPGTEPSKPAMANTEEVHQHALAYVLVEPGVQSIAESKIENVVGKSETPFVTAILETVSIDSLFTQWNGQFSEWFENVQSQLEGDVVTNLQRQIDLKVPKSDISSLAVNRLVLPNGSEKFGQLAFPSEDNAVLMQNKTGAPGWATPYQATERLGIYGRILATFPDITFAANGTKGIKIGPYMYSGNKFRNVSLVFNVIGPGEGTFRCTVSGVTSEYGIHTKGFGSNATSNQNYLFNMNTSYVDGGEMLPTATVRIDLAPYAGQYSNYTFSLAGTYFTAEREYYPYIYKFGIQPDVAYNTLAGIKSYLNTLTLNFTLSGLARGNVSFSNIQLREW